MNKITSQKLALHLGALLEFAHQENGISLGTVRISRFTPSVRAGVAYLGVSWEEDVPRETDLTREELDRVWELPDGRRYLERQFLIEITEVGRLDLGWTDEETCTGEEQRVAEETAARIEAPCGCFSRPGETDDGEKVVCMHGNELEPWPEGVWPSL